MLRFVLLFLVIWGVTFALVNSGGVDDISLGGAIGLSWLLSGITWFAIALPMYMNEASELSLSGLYTEEGIITSMEYKIQLDKFEEVISDWAGGYFNDYKTVLSQASNNQVVLNYSGQYQKYRIVFKNNDQSVTVKVIDQGDANSKSLAYLSIKGVLTYYPNDLTHRNTIQAYKVQESHREIMDLESSLNNYFNSLLNNQPKP